MEPRAPTPWRVLESPPLDVDEEGSSTKPQRRAEVADPSPSASLAPRVLAIGGAAAACAIVAFVLAAGGGSGTVQVEGGSGLAVASRAVPGSADPGLGSADLVAEIIGAVKQPGVYRLPAGSRVGDLLTAAGGYGPRVDTARSERELNLAATLTDGAQVRVPSRDDAPGGDGGAAGASGAGGSVGSTGGSKVDLNHANQAELEALPGIGPATAQKILAAREEAPFASVDELRSRGILGEKTFDKLRDLITVG
jgi:competence protein ComEA